MKSNLSEIGLIAIGFILTVFFLSTIYKEDNKYTITIDQETGCHYISAGNNSAIHPRLNSSGIQICEP